MRAIDPNRVLSHAVERGIPENTISTLRNAGIDLDHWLKGFDNVSDSVRHSVQTIRNHPLMPKDIPVHGLVIHPSTGRLEVIINGYGEESHTAA
jgi:carbonic anhydrase